MPTVVVVHGLWMPGTETVLLRHRLESAGFDTISFSYHSLAADVEDNATRLADLVREITSDSIHLVGHSLGGVIAVKAMQEHGLETVGRIVCLGSPLRGSAAGRRLSRVPGGDRLLGKSKGALVEKPVAPWTSPVELGIIAGRAAVGLGVLLGALPKPHDGTVAVEETRLEGATDHIVLPVSHTAMILSRTVADEVISFLDTGHFVDPATLRESRRHGTDG